MLDFRITLLNRALEWSQELERGAALKQWGCRILPGARADPEHSFKALFLKKGLINYNVYFCCNTMLRAKFWPDSDVTETTKDISQSRNLP